MIDEWIKEMRESKGKLEDLDLGIVIKDSGQLGIDIFDKSGKHILFINKLGEKMLLDWLKEKDLDTPEWIDRNYIKIKRKSWRKS